MNATEKNIKAEYGKITVEEAYQSGFAKKIGIPKFSWTFATPLVYRIDSPINNRGRISLDEIYPSLTEQEKKMTVAKFLKSQKPSNKIYWVLGIISLIVIGITLIQFLNAIS